MDINQDFPEGIPVLEHNSGEEENFTVEVKEEVEETQEKVAVEDEEDTALERKKERKKAKYKSQGQEKIKARA